MDETKLGDLLRNSAAHDPLEPIEPERVVRRGENGLRRRRTVGVAGAVAAVAAVSWGASTLTDVDSPDGTPPAATTGTTQSTTSNLLKPLPGVQRGEAALGRISDAEAGRRCGLRYPSERHRPLHSQYGGFRGGGTGEFSGVPRTIHTPVRCNIPGDSKPTAEALAMFRRDPFPTTDAGKLRNCSVMLWHDITGWRVLTSDAEPRTLVNLVAKSPSGRQVAWCSLDGDPNSNGGGANETRIVSLVDQPPPPPGRRPTGTPTTQPDEWSWIPGGVHCARQARACPTGWLHDYMGQLKDHRVVRVRIEKRSGEFHDVKVVDGWFAIAWADKRGKGNADVRWTKYDAAGNVIR